MPSARTLPSMSTIPVAPGAAALNTSRPEQVKRNLALASADIPVAFWAAMKDARLISSDYPYLG